MRKRGSLLVALVAVVVALVFPWLIPDPTATSIATFTLIFAAGAVAWNLFSGYTGYLSLGHSAYFGIGAYTLAVLCQSRDIAGGPLPFLLLPVTGLAAAAAAVPLGWFVLATRNRFVFVAMTIAIFYALQLFAYNLPGVTNGSGGMFLPLPPWGGDIYNDPFYYVALGLLALALIISWWVRHSKFGLGLLAIRDDEERAEGLGIKATRYKHAAYVISAGLVGMVGALDAYFVGFINPLLAFTPNFDLNAALMSMLGGLGTLSGPVLGALIIEPAQQFLITQYGESGLGVTLVGALLLAVLLVLPEGIVPTLRRRWVARLGGMGKPPQKDAPQAQEIPGLAEQEG